MISSRLAPESLFPGAVEDAVAGLQYMATHQPEVLGPDTAAGKLLVCGDSAGGGLALALLEAIRTGGVFGKGVREEDVGVAGEAAAAGPTAPPRTPAPRLTVAGCATISAWTDLTCTVETYATRTTDPIFSTGNPAADSLAGSTGAMRYVGTVADMVNPLASPMHTPAAGLAELPKLLMMVGDAEVMLGDTTEYAALALEAGTDNLTLRIFRSMWHCWPLYCEGCGQFPEEAAQRMFPTKHAEMGGGVATRGDAASSEVGFAPAVDALAEIGSFFRTIAATP